MARTMKWNVPSDRSGSRSRGVTAPACVMFPDPLSYEYIDLEDEDARGAKIGYTDCMESSVLRFMEVMLCDPLSLSPAGVPTQVDQELVHKRVKDPEVVAYFEQNPHILAASSYNPTGVCGSNGFDARQEWSRLVTRKTNFNYKRATNGVYKNDAIQGRLEIPGEVEMHLELEPCLHNIITVFRDFLGVDFAEVDQDRPASWSNNIEAHARDVSESVQSHFDVAARQLSRPGMALQFQVHVPSKNDTSFQVHIDITVNGQEAWTWLLSRRRLTVADTATARRLTADCAQDDAGHTVFLTSSHSEIRKARPRG